MGEKMKTSWLFLMLGVVFLLSGCDRDYMSRTAAEKEMKVIANAALEFERELHRPPNNIDELEDAGYYTPNATVKHQWELEINWPDEIIAFSTSRHPSGEGITVSYTIPQKY